MPYRIYAYVEQKRQHMRKLSIAAAHKIFILQGDEATEMPHIAREAEIPIGNCYFYFSTKEALCGCC